MTVIHTTAAALKPDNRPAWFQTRRGRCHWGSVDGGCACCQPPSVAAIVYDTSPKPSDAMLRSRSPSLSESRWAV